jgi:hypothetical protein
MGAFLVQVENGARKNPPDDRAGFFFVPLAGET